MRRKLLLSLLFSFTASAAAFPAAADDAVIIASTAPGYALGQVVPDGASVRLPEGSSAFFLLASGRTVSLKGPYDGGIDAAPTSSASPGFGQLWTGSGYSQSDLGAARSFGGPAAADTALAIDPSRPGRHCVVAGSAPILRKPGDATFAKAMLVDPQGGTKADLNWPSGADTLPWPSAIPLADGARITVLDASGQQRHDIELHLIKNDMAGTPGLAVGLAAAGCADQAAALLRPVRDALVPLELYLSSDRGLYPTYRTGEPIRLVLQTNRDAHLYCFLRNARGDLLPIFPSSLSGGSAVKAHAPLAFPGERMPLPIKADNQEVRCFATERDVSGEIPTRNVEFHPLGPDMIAQLERSLEDLRRETLAMGQIVLSAE